MKILLCALIITLSAANASAAYTVYCTNCSDRVTQAIEKATSLEQLTTLLKEYDEAIQQTAAQLQMVQQNIEQYTNMVQNTVMLPANIIRKISSELSKVARITNALNTMRNDVAGLGNVFDGLYQAQAELKKLANMPRNMLSQGGMTYRTSWDSWSRRVDDSTRATFQLSGQQLKDLEESAELEAYMNELLSSPDGQQKALMAGNQLAALQIQKARQLRELIATKVQSDLASQEKAEKESQMGQELHRQMLDGFGELDTTSRPDPF
ncbi:P-type conjugative transfer protein TrbJ [Desulfovibrio sp. ZJ369]|uniref:P-type conjugative transfer protein TrbJ n=1 Tax=Desulfovibrio sp. ZJ369 TaxID=2709793 RepID=UPI0013EB734E|nr:P-type conjugative transfer protein TrbJ [Desulfovibrio sp. ZJ369]